MPPSAAMDTIMAAATRPMRIKRWSQLSPLEMLRHSSLPSFFFIKAI